ncbi:hypothetical protein SPI_01976 [Niveomyces insectorum RCEF 264]|uniref:Uncharacterized protein n=1 Tax=Niveomyces insectorum RCEF 264 TaxID=1081102 RepID=A0A167XNF9_9HYPO|nr:hypothetical protein SPI_01976 [Niveomyces insectorum RCEF 264]
MLPTKTVRSLKGMLPQIHQPLPLNEKSTKKLLDTLTASFRKHLDREHGLWDDERASVASESESVLRPPRPSRPATVASSDVRPLPQSNPDRRPSPSAAVVSQRLQNHTRQQHNHRPTDRHLRAILANPLFSYDQAMGRQAVAAVERDPMDIFDWAVARGLMTTKRAAGCLLAKRREAVQSSHASAVASMAASGAGRKVLQWLRSSGLERDLSFVADTQLAGLLVQFLAAEEGLDVVVWNWIERLQRGEGPQTIRQQGGKTATGHLHEVSSASFLLDKLVKAKASGATTLDDAYRAMCRGAELFDKTTPAFEGNVFWPWCALSWMSTFKAWNLATPSPQLYETFVAIMAHDDRPSIRLERAHLDLRHPTRPTPAPAVALLADDHLLRDVQASTSAAEPPLGRRPGYPGRIVSMGLDTVRHLAFIGESREAQRILERLRQQFGGHLDQLLIHT